MQHCRQCRELILFFKNYFLKKKNYFLSVLFRVHPSLNWSQVSAQLSPGCLWASPRCCNTCLSNGPRPHRSDPIKARTRLPREHTSELHLKPLTYSHSSKSHADSAFLFRKGKAKAERSNSSVPTTLITRCSSNTIKILVCNHKEGKDNRKYVHGL